MPFLNSVYGGLRLSHVSITGADIIILILPESVNTVYISFPVRDGRESISDSSTFSILDVHELVRPVAEIITARTTGIVYDDIYLEHSIGMHVESHERLIAIMEYLKETKL